MNRLINFLIRHEGIKLKPYLCPAGKWSIFVGRNYEDNPFTTEELTYIFKNGMTIDTAKWILKRDIKESEFWLRQIFENFESFTEGRKIVLISVMFNLGLDRFNTFAKMIKAIQENDWKEAAKQLKDSKRHKQIPNRSDEECEMLRQG